MSIVITKKDMNEIMAIVHAPKNVYSDCTVFSTDGLVRLDVVHTEDDIVNAWVGFKDSEVYISLRNIAFVYDSEDWAICDEFDSIHEFLKIV